MTTLIFPVEFPDNQGGAPQSICSIVKGLGNNPDFKVIVVCPKGSEMSLIPFPANVIVRTTGAAEWTISKSAVRGTIATIFDLFHQIRPYLKEHPWVVTNQPVESALMALLPHKHIKEIYINRGGNFQDKKSVATRITYSKLKLRRIEYAVGISRRQFDVLNSCGMPKERVELIHNGLPLPSILYDYTELSKDCLRISTMGYISELKNQIEGVRLIKILRDKGINAILNIFGINDSDAEYQEKLSLVISELDVSPYINFCGFVTGERLFENTDVVISFSYSEGFGRSLVEGMLRKKPIIAWRGAGGPLDITCDGKYGHLVENNEASEYYAVLSSLFDNPQYNRSNVEESYDYAFNHFTQERMVANYVALFKRVCK